MIAISKSDAERYGCPHCQHPIDLEHFDRGATDSALKCSSEACKQAFIICIDGKAESACVPGTSFREPIKVQRHPFSRPVTRAEIEEAIRKGAGLPPLSDLTLRMVAAGEDADKKLRRRGRG